MSPLGEEQTTAIARSLSFGAEAAAYERGRPSYPPEAIDWLLPRGARDVLDLGAGTGKLTTRLVERGLSVVAVDPIPEMLEVLSNSLPDTPALLGTAEEIPLPDHSVDAVLVAQAWHWFDPTRAVPEVSRVLRPGSSYDDIERWLTYVTLMLVGARAQGLSDAGSDRRLLTRMLLPALLETPG